MFKLWSPTLRFCSQLRFLYGVKITYTWQIAWHLWLKTVICESSGSSYLNFLKHITWGGWIADNGLGLCGKQGIFVTWAGSQLLWHIRPSQTQVSGCAVSLPWSFKASLWKQRFQMCSYPKDRYLKVMIQEINGIGTGLNCSFNLNTVA